MKKRVFIITISIAAAFIVMAGGYGVWQNSVNINGNITVTAPPPGPEGIVVEGIKGIEANPTGIQNGRGTGNIIITDDIEKPSLPVEDKSSMAENRPSVPESSEGTGQSPDGSYTPTAATP